MKSFTDMIPTTKRKRSFPTLLEWWLKEPDPVYARDYRIKDKRLRFWRESNSKPLTVSIEDLTEELQHFHTHKQWNFDHIDPIKDMIKIGLLEDPTFTHKYMKGIEYPVRLTKKGVKLPIYKQLLEFI